MIRVVRSGGFVPPRRDHPPELSPGFAAACRAFGRELADDHEIVGEHGGGDEQGEALGTFGAATLHAAPRINTEMRPSIISRSFCPYRAGCRYSLSLASFVRTNRASRSD